MNFVEFLQAVLDSATITAQGETHPASDIYTPESLDSSSHTLMWDEWRIHRTEPSKLSDHVTAYGETWLVTL